MGSGLREGQLMIEKNPQMTVEEATPKNGLFTWDCYMKGKYSLLPLSCVIYARYMYLIWIGYYAKMLSKLVVAIGIVTIPTKGVRVPITGTPPSHLVL